MGCAKGALTRKWRFIPTKYNTEEAKKSYAKDTIRKINKLLKEGYHVDRKKTRTKKNENSKKSANKLTNFLNVEKSIEKYISHCKNKLKNNKEEVARKKRTLNRFF